jgi:lysophospholipid acyltransferase
MLPDDQIRVLSILFAAVPLSYLLRQLPPSTRLYFSIAGALGLQYYAYGREIWIPLVMHVAMYLLMLAKGRQCGMVVTLTAMVLLSIYHIQRMIVDYGGWTLDVSTIMMGNVCKYSLLAFAYQDGAQVDKQLETEDQRTEKVTVLPNFLDYIGYLLFLPTAAVSTPMSYHKYSQYMNQCDQFASIPFKETLLAIRKDGAIALGCGVLYLLGNTYTPISTLTEHNFTDQPFWPMLGYVIVSTHLIQAKYFFSFKLCLLPMHAAGITYDPALKDHFKGIETIRIRRFVFSTSVPEKVNSWNIPVQEWLRKCVYERLVDSVSKGKAKLITFMVSAFWHGFYGGYYIAFTLTFLQLYLAGLVFKLTRN